MDIRSLLLDLYGEPQQPETPALPWQNQAPATTKTLATRVQEALGAREPATGGLAQDILSARFQESPGTSYGDYSQGIIQSALGKPTLGSEFTGARTKDLVNSISSMDKLNQQNLQSQMEMMKFGETMRHNRATEGISRDRINSGTGGYVDPETGEFIQSRKLSASEQKEIFDTSDMVNASTGAKSALERAKSILEGNLPGSAEPYSGFMATTRADVARLPVVGDFLADKKRGSATTEYRTLVMEQALNNLKAIFGGMPTEGERQVLLQMQALPEYTPEEQSRIINNAISAADKRLEFNQRKARAIETGNYGAMMRPPAGEASPVTSGSGIKFLGFE